MNTLTTRKIVLGILITLVLAFSVQGTADALTFGTSRSGDLQTVVVDNEFTISFSVSPGSNTTRITDADGKLIKDSSTDGGTADARIDSSDIWLWRLMVGTIERFQLLQLVPLS